eukprot:461391-Pyramimonas_sp.AAC.1
MLPSYTKCKIICVLSWALQILARATLWVSAAPRAAGPMPSQLADPAAKPHKHSWPDLARAHP